MTGFASKVFGRSSSDHPYETALVDWQRSGDEVKMAMACNVRHDHRVSPDREEKFDEFCRHPRTAKDLQDGIAYYFKEKVRTRDYPHFVYYEINANNLIHGHAKLAHTQTRSLHSTPPHTALSHADRSSLLHREQKLLRILDINNLRMAYRWLLDVNNRKPEWADCFKTYYSIPRNLKDDEEQAWVDQWLEIMLDTNDAGQRVHFIEVVLDMLNCIRHEAAFQPTWATTWHAFEPHARNSGGEPDADRWVQVMGMGKNPAYHWYIALTYTVAEAGTVARPTQLDGGWYEYHFPSPEEAPLELGGHPMELDVRHVAKVLLPEYIHKQIRHPLKHWDDTGRLLGRTTASFGSNLINMRRAHQKLLTSTYATDEHTNCPNRSLCKI